jgi:hypothetical protein
MKVNGLKVLVVVLLAIALTGCEIAARVKTTGKYEGLANKDPSKGQIFVYRESAFAGAANQYDVMLNGKLVGSLPNGSFFSVPATPGQTKIEPRTLTSFGLGKGTSVNVEAGKSYCFKMTLNFCLQCKSADITPVSTEQCERDMKSLRSVVLDL